MGGPDHLGQGKRIPQSRHPHLKSPGGRLPDREQAGEGPPEVWPGGPVILPAKPPTGGVPLMAAKKRRGRPLAKDKRQPLPFRMKGTLIEKCRRKGREWLERLVKEAR